MVLVWFLGAVFYASNVINYIGTYLVIAGALTNTWLLIILADYFICRGWLRLGRMEGVEFPSFLAMIIGPLLHVAITAAAKARYYEPVCASAKHEGH